MSEAKQVLAVPGLSAWKTIQPHVRCSYGFWKAKSRAGLAPRAHPMSKRMVLFNNAEVLIWIGDPSGYNQAEVDAKRKAED